MEGDGRMGEVRRDRRKNKGKGKEGRGLTRRRRTTNACRPATRQGANRGRWWKGSRSNAG
eukprot:scaffold826_cov335-Pavlova_lutheri.AAC.16